MCPPPRIFCNHKKETIVYNIVLIGLQCYQLKSPCLNVKAHNSEYAVLRTLSDLNISQIEVPLYSPELKKVERTVFGQLLFFIALLLQLAGYSL